MACRHQDLEARHQIMEAHHQAMAARLRPMGSLQLMATVVLDQRHLATLVMEQLPSNHPTSSNKQVSCLSSSDYSHHSTRNQTHHVIPGQGDVHI